MHKNDPKDSLKKAATDGADFRSERYHGRDRLFNGSPSGNGRGAARRRRCTRWQMVNGEESRLPGAGQRLKGLAIKLREPAEPFGTYVEAVQTGNMLFLTWMLPTEGREAKFIGRVRKVDQKLGNKERRK